MSRQSALADAVNEALASLIEAASQNVGPIRAQIAQIRSDIAKLDEGDFAVPALKQAINSLEVAENSTMDKAKEALGLLIAQWCKEHGIALAAVQASSRKMKATKWLTAEEKTKAAEAVLEGARASDGLSRGEAAKLARITPEQAATILKKLVADGKLITQGMGKNTRYLKKEPLRTQTQQQVAGAASRLGEKD